MPDAVKHVENATPEASADDVKTMYKDTPTGDRDPATYGVRVDSDDGDDPKTGGTPVHPAPSDDQPRS